MAKTYLIHGMVYRDHAFTGQTVLLQDGRVYFPETVEPEEGDTVIEAEGTYVVPGFIDVHTHGAVGIDVNGASSEDLRKIGRFYAGNGTTSFLMSVLTDTEAQTRWCIEQAKHYEDEKGTGANLLGIHLEGPFLSPDYKGAMPEHLLREADLPLLSSYQEQAEGRIRYITVSPEVPGITDMIQKIRDLGITVSIGHSGADYKTAMEAIRNGAACSTHTCNAMRLLHQHEPAILGAVLESDIYAEMICDGRHLHPGIVRLLLKVKGYDRMVAITDSIMAAGLPDGNYHLGVNAVTVKDGDAKLTSDGTRAGSTLTQIQAFHNLMEFTGEPAEKILPLLTENPAKMLGVFDRKGSLEEGKDADLLVLSASYDIEKVFVQGEQIYGGE